MVSAGFRAEYFEMNNKESQLEPILRAGLNYQLTEGTYIRCSYGQGYRYPTIAEKFIETGAGGISVFPNPEVQPESSWNAEAGIKQGFKIEISLVLLILLFLNNAITTPLNIFMHYGNPIN